MFLCGIYRFYLMRKLLIILTVFFPFISRSQVVINEIMQSNIDCVMDDLNDFPDSWVEIYNGTESTINLSYYKIGLTDDPSTAWSLPYKEVNAHEYILIYCDKEEDGLHTNFRLDSGKGGSVYFFIGNTLIDKLENIAKQPAPNIAYGRETDGSDKWGYQYEATPAKQNCGKICSTLLPDVIFSHNGSVFSSSNKFSLSLAMPDDVPEGTIIRYTLNGSEPTLLNGYTYQSPIEISSTKIVHACLFCDNCLTPRSISQSYVFLNRTQTLPVISLTTDDKYLYDNTIGIYTDGTYNSDKKNYYYDWRRPVTIEMYEKDGTTCSLNQLGEMRIQGAGTRSASLKSLALYANKRFGEKHFKHEFFPDQRPGQTKYKSILLRNAGNDFDYLYMRDAIIQRTMATNTDIDWQAWRPAIIYINGVYKGIENIRERSGDDNIYTNYDGLEDIDMIENLGELKSGTWDNWNAFKTFYTDHGHTMAEYAEWLDLEEFINIYAMNLFYNNQDWPGNNTVWWRPRAEGGKWRIIAKDTDFGLGLYGSSASYDTMSWLYNNSYDSNRAWGNTYDATRLFRRLMEDADFQREFIDHCAVYMGDFLNSAGTRAIWDPMYEIIKTEYPTHRALFNQWWPNYSEELSKARQWVVDRPGYFYDQLRSKYSLGALVTLKLVTANIDSDILQKVQFEINGVPLRSGAFDGEFYAGRNLNITCRPLTAEELQTAGIEGDTENIEVKSWFVTGTNTVTITEKELSMSMPSSGSVIIVPTLGVTSGINDVTIDEDDSEEASSLSASKSYSVYDLQGRQYQGSRPSGVYIQRSKNGKVHKVVLEGK